MLIPHVNLSQITLRLNLPMPGKPAKIKQMGWVLIFLISMDWLQINDQGFNIFYRPGMEKLAKALSREAPEAKKLLERDLGFEFNEPVKIVLASSDQDFQAVQGRVPEWAIATAHPKDNTIFLKPLKSTSPEEAAVTFRHELAHLLIYHRLNGRSAPRWFEEGMAVLCSGEFEYQRFQVLALMSLSGNFIPLETLSDGFPYNETEARAAYLESESFVSFLIETLDERGFSQFLDQVASGREFYQALSEATGLSFPALEKKWAARVRTRYGLTAALGGSTSLWFLITVLFLYAYLVKKRKTALKKKWLELESGLPAGDDLYDYEEEDGEGNGEDETWH